MTVSRYSITPEQVLKDSDYKKVYSEKFDENRRLFLSKISTLNIKYPEFSDVLNFDYTTHVWSMGDRYYKLAYQYYGDPEYWWVIAWFNKKPTEGHVSAGDIIRVPKPIGEVLSTLGY